MPKISFTEILEDWSCSTQLEYTEAEYSNNAILKAAADKLLERVGRYSACGADEEEVED